MWEFKETMSDIFFCGRYVGYSCLVLLYSALGNLWDVQTKESSDILSFKKGTGYMSATPISFCVLGVGLHFQPPLQLSVIMWWSSDQGNAHSPHPLYLPATVTPSYVWALKLITEVTSVGFWVTACSHVIYIL